jgi:hypothetical protein
VETPVEGYIYLCVITCGTQAWEGFGDTADEAVSEAFELMIENIAVKGGRQ